MDLRPTVLHLAVGVKRGLYRREGPPPAPTPLSKGPELPSPPTTRAGKPIRERILLYGDSDAGKTFNYLTTARWHQRRGSDAVFYGICTPGNEWDRFFAPGGEFEDLENVVPYDVQDIQEYFDAYDTIRKAVDAKLKRRGDKDAIEDWLCVDVIDDAWKAAGDEYAKREWKGQDLGSKWAVEGGDYPVEGWEWGPINARYRAFAQNRVIRFPGHVMALAWDKALQEAAKSTGKGGETQEVRDTFALVGMKPAGQKEDYKRFHTLLHLAKNPKGEWVVRTARDRQRPRLGVVQERGRAVTYQPHKLRDFMLEYLVKTAGWKL